LSAAQERFLPTRAVSPQVVVQSRLLLVGHKPGAATDPAPAVESCLPPAVAEGPAAAAAAAAVGLLAAACLHHAV